MKLTDKEEARLLDLENKNADVTYSISDEEVDELQDLLDKYYGEEKYDE